MGDLLAIIFFFLSRGKLKMGVWSDKQKLKAQKDTIGFPGKEVKECRILIRKRRGEREKNDFAVSCTQFFFLLHVGRSKKRRGVVGGRE